MKRLFIFILLSPYLTYAQFDFTPDTTDSIRIAYIKKPNIDNVIFELRVWEDNAWFPPIFYRLIFGNDSIWSYERGLIYDDDSLIIMPQIHPEPNIDELWNQLLSFEILTLESQDKEPIKIVRNGLEYMLTREQYEKMMATDGVVYTLELYSKSGFRSFWYYNPVQMSKKMKNSNDVWIAPEHHNAANIFTLIRAQLGNRDFRTIFQKIIKQN